MRKLPPEASRFAEIIRAHLPDLRRQYGVTSLALFGSYVRGDQRQDSDLDVLVEFSRQPSLGDLVDLRDELAAMLPVKVDLVMRKTLKPRIGQLILREAVPV